MSVTNGDLVKSVALEFSVPEEGLTTAIAGHVGHDRARIMEARKALVVRGRAQKMSWPDIAAMMGCNSKTSVRSLYRRVIKELGLET